MMSSSPHHPIFTRTWLAVFLSANITLAAPAWVNRSVTLPRHDWAFDLGLGLGHHDRPSDATGFGMNLDGSVGVTQHLELGMRAGFRFDGDGRATQADKYGRLFDRETFGTSYDDFANPEFRIRGGLVNGRIFELALEGRVALPVEDGTRIASQFGMPVRLHLGNVVRLDTGLYVPVSFYDPVVYAVSVPLDVWIQASSELWLGPMTGVRAYYEDPNDHTDVSLGFGIGYSASSAFDIKGMVLMPAVNHTEGARNFGVGFGFQARIE